MKRCPDTYFIVVIEDLQQSQVIGAATLVAEQKFIHKAAVVSSLPLSSLCIMFSSFSRLAFQLAVDIFFCVRFQAKCAHLQFL